ncbi:MULE domain-containing protein, partial [Aphis craccivora]
MMKNPIQLFHTAISGTTKTISSHITKESVKQIVKRQRRINLNQNEPKTIQSIDPPQTLCTTLSGEYFLVKKTEYKILADGTFKSCPNIFQQLYCIHASIKRGSEEIYVSLVYCFLVGKSQAIYSEMFNLINQYCNENNIDVTENTDLEIIKDFEIAAIASINEFYPFAVHSTCFFHFCQNIYRKIQNVGLSIKYSNDADFNLLARHIPAMTFLPIDMIQEAWSLLKPLFSNSNEEKSLITYFEETYVLGKIGMRTKGRPNNVPSRNPPLFSPDIWSVSNRVKLELPRTTNTAE